MSSVLILSLLVTKTTNLRNLNIAASHCHGVYSTTATVTAYSHHPKNSTRLSFHVQFFGSTSQVITSFCFMVIVRFY